MVDVATGVLKRNAVNSSPTTAATKQAGAASYGAAAVGAAQAAREPQARIFQQLPGRVVIEVTCACGQKIYLDCEC